MDTFPGGQSANLPDYEAVGRKPTLNKMGWMHPHVDPIVEELLEYATENLGLRVLEVGAAYGYASKALLEKGAEVWVNDLDPRHLANFKEQLQTPEDQARAHIVAGDFSQHLGLPPESFDSILAVRVLHFFEPAKLEASAVLMSQLLKKGGSVFIVAETPYLSHYADFIPQYELRKKQGDLYPGFIEDVTGYSPRTESFLPPIRHFLDPDVLTRVFTAVGFEVEKAIFLDRPDYPETMRRDGRESVGFIARKI